MLNPRTKAFTLVELLIVIAIIGILAALLLPALNGGQRRAQRIYCENSLQEIGIAFHVFSNDHTGKFPMDVSTNDGGSMEYIKAGFQAGQIFYTAYHTFQVLSNELVRPQILVCPADLRAAVSNFPALQNQNLSYFIGANGTFDKPTSILAGDRNLTTNSVEAPTILEIGPGSRLSWTWEMHQFQGNVVFADGHVEEWNQSGLQSAENQFSPDESLFMPSAVVLANSNPVGPGSGPGNGGGSGNGGNPGNGGNSGGAVNPGNGGNSGPATQPAIYQASSTPVPVQPPAAMSPGSPAPMAAPISGGTHDRGSISGTAQTVSGTEASSDTAATTTTTESNATVTVATPIDADAAMSPFDRHLAKSLRHTLGWLYLLLLLLALIYLIYRLLKWMRDRDEKMKARRLR